MSASCAMEETQGGEVSPSCGSLSDGSSSLVWMCCSSLSRVVCRASGTTKQSSHIFTCVLILGCPAQENSNFRSCVSVERLFIGSLFLAVWKGDENISPLAVCFSAGREVED